MAEIIWQKRAERELLRYLTKGHIQFGESVANRFFARVKYINGELEKFPEIGYPEPLLKDRKKCYRAIQIIGSFKLIYHYNQKLDIVNVADIWDTRREPKTLSKRI